MIAIGIELLHGTFRGDPTGAAKTGGLSRGEWPPAPFRVFAAFVAADGTGKRCRVTDGSELAWLERQPAPVIHAHPDPFHQRLRSRYVANQGRRFAKSGRTLAVHREYIGRKGVEVRPGVRVTPRHPRIAYLYEVDTPGDAMLAALRRRAARIGYLGASDSPVRVRVLTREPPAISAAEAFTPHPDGDLRICVPAPGDLLTLDRMYRAWGEQGASIVRTQFPTLRHEESYRSPGFVAPRATGEVAAWLRVTPAVPGRRVGAMTALFKEAVLAKYQAIHGEPPAVLHGHGFTGAGYDLARFLALPDAGFPHSRGRIHGLALWLPPGFDSPMTAKVRDAAFAIRTLRGRGLRVAVTAWGGERSPRAADPQRWERPARRWSTAFPAIHERRVPLTLTEVSRWCRHAGLPAPEGFRAGRGPLIRGGVDLAPVEVNRPGRPGLPYSHVELCFGEPVRGPVVVGSGRQRGFGFCVPVDETAPVRDDG